jgi:hypothetical protein
VVIAPTIGQDVIVRARIDRIRFINMTLMRAVAIPRCAHQSKTANGEADGEER